jgi:hypothetical protein
MQGKTLLNSWLKKGRDNNFSVSLEKNETMRYEQMSEINIIKDKLAKDDVNC